MHQLEPRLREFDKTGVTAVAGPGELSTLLLEHDGSRARVCTHGAHVLEFAPRAQPAVLWLSPDAVLDARQPIRGGIPICWPWFAAHPLQADLPAHGFARNVAWRVVESVSNRCEKAVSLVLEDDVSTRGMWPHPFSLCLRVALSAHLSVALQVTNTGADTVSFSAALHSYFAVGDVSRVTLEGLGGRDYLDKVEGNRRKRQAEPMLDFRGETDRIYLDTSADCIIHDPVLRRRIRIAKTGSRSTVVWNPWQARARQMADFPDDGYSQMLCVETANAADDLVELAAGCSHTLAVAIGVQAR